MSTDPIKKPSFFDDVKQTFSSRIKHPLISSFLISWFFFNWRVILIILSEKEIENKITLAESHLGWWNTLVIPLLLAIFYVLALPYISNIIANLVWKARKANIISEYKEKLTHIKEEKLLASENFKLEQARSGKRELEQLREQIEQLTEANNKKDEVLSILRARNEELKLDINKVVANIPILSKDFKYLNDADNELLIQLEILDDIQNKKSVVKKRYLTDKYDRFIINDMINKGYLKYRKDNMDYIEITEKGKDIESAL